MAQLRTSPWFIAWAALCCAVTVAFVTWASGAGSGDGRVLAAVVGIVLGLAMAFAVPIAVLPEREQEREVRPVVPAPVPAPPREWERKWQPEPSTLVQAPPPAPVEAPTAAIPADLDAQLEQGRTLQDDPEKARVDEWIADTRAALAGRPGVARYFAALDAKPWPDEAKRLEAHLRRLETIVRDFG